MDFLFLGRSMLFSLVDKTTFSSGGQIADRKYGLGTLELIPLTIHIEIK